MPHDTEDWCKIWTKTNFLFQNWQEFGDFWSENSKVSKIYTWIGPFCERYMMFNLKRYWRVIFHEIEESCKIWRKASLPFGKWHEDFGKFSSEHLKISKICTLKSCFSPKYKMFELKTYRGVIFNGTEYWCKIWSKNYLCFQKWHEEFGKVLLRHVWKSKNLDFYWVLLSKVENVWAWNLQEIYVSW